jgi:hypothetical protein
VPVVVWNVVGHCNLSCPTYAKASKEPSAHDLSPEQGSRCSTIWLQGSRVVIFSGGNRTWICSSFARAKALGLIPQRLEQRVHRRRGRQRA